MENEKITLPPTDETNDQKASIEETIEKVYDAIRASKGYDPATQFAGYILSEDPIYIPDRNNARGLISHVDRDELLKFVIEYYLEHRFEKKK